MILFASFTSHLFLPFRCFPFPLQFKLWSLILVCLELFLLQLALNCYIIFFFVDKCCRLYAHAHAHVLVIFQTFYNQPAPLPFVPSLHMVKSNLFVYLLGHHTKADKKTRSQSFGPRQTFSKTSTQCPFTCISCQ